jgi:hypothetical protein
MIFKEYRVNFKDSRNVDREMVWSNQPPQVRGRRRAQNVVQGPVGEPLGLAKTAKMHVEASELFFTETIFTQLVRFTNMKIQRIRNELSPEVLEDSRVTLLHWRNKHD